MPKLFKHGKPYCCILYKNGKPQWFNTRESDYELAKIKRDRKIGELTAESKGEIVARATWEQVKEAFFVHLEARHRSPRSIQTYRNAFKQLERHCPLTYFDELGEHKIDALCLKRRDIIKESSLDRYICCYKKICSWAVGKYAVRHLLKGYPKFCPSNTVVNDLYFTVPQLKALLPKVHDTALKTEMYISAYAGLSPADSRILKWSAVNFDKDEITYSRAKIAQRHPHIVKVPLNTKLKRYLLGLPRSEKNDFICAYPDGRVMTAGDAAQKTKKFMRRNGFRGYTLTTFRHTFISHCIMAGVDSAVVAAWAGHQNNNQIRAYLHLSPSFKKDSINKLPY
ncbi:hypothetical protein CCP3SC15_210023 [Gammaproteobacteria bacterium]